MNQASGTHGEMYMGRGLASCINALYIQENIWAHKIYMLFNHAVSGCESMSMLFQKSKKTVLL